MVKKIKWCVLGGWGIEPEVLKPLFGENSNFFDVNQVMCEIVKKGQLCKNWEDVFCKKILSTTDSADYIAGWSTGAIIAMACAKRLKPIRLILISPTLSFCRNTIFKYGIKPVLLQKMREKIFLEPIEVISEFRKKCGFDAKEKQKIRWSKEELICGLYFLEQVIIEPKELHCLPLIIHGTRDEIIPSIAGESLYKKYGGFFLKLDAPHACFLNNEEKIKETVENYVKGLQYESI